METPYRKDCSQGLAHVRKDLFSVQKRAFKYNIKLYKAVIRSAMTYACPTWEYAVDAHLLKLQRLQNRVLGAVGNIHRCTPVRELHVAFKIQYAYENINYAGHKQN
jgi:hypothetical protein